MSSEIEIAGMKISGVDWDATPESVKAVVVTLSERLAYIEEQLKQSSQNSSRPPSRDDFGKPEKSKVKKQKKPRERDSSGKIKKLYPTDGGNL
jgi:transposase